MDMFLKPIEEDSSSGEIREERPIYFLSKVNVCNYAKITMNEYQNLPKKTNFLYWNYVTKICLSGLQRQVKFCLKFFDFVPIFFRNSSNSSRSNMSKNSFTNKYVPIYQSDNILWYERDDLLTYIDVLKYKEFLNNCD